VNIDTSNTFVVFFFQSHFLTPDSLYVIRHFYIVPHFTLSSIHLQRRIKSQENRRDEVLRLISSPDDIRTVFGADISNARTKKVGGLPIVNGV